MTIGEDEEVPKEAPRLGAAADPEEVDDLDEHPGPTLARPAHGVDQLLEAGQEAIVPDSEQWPAGNVADAGRLDHERARLAAGEALVPLEHRGRHVTVLGRAPGHHRRHPRALGQVEPSDVERTEPARCRRGLGGGRSGGWDWMVD